MAITPVDFVRKWKGVQLKERSASQSHFNDLCELIGHPTPIEDDPTGERFTFEKGASKASGGDGWADVWKRGYFGWEYKGKHADLDKAYQQLLMYKDALENPPLLVTCDIDRIIVHSNFTNTVKNVVEITLDDLLTGSGLDNLRAIFREPQRFKSTQTSEQVTEAAAAEFARLADHLRKWGDDSEKIAHYLIRVLFCLFSEDIGLLPKDLFTRLIDQGRRDPSAFNRQVKNLFRCMATGDYFGEHRIRHFNGGLFDNDDTIDLDHQGVAILHRVAGLDWAAIEPSILGTLFTRSLDPDKRSQLGAHYTSKEDILLIVEPVLMQPLRRKWDEVRIKVLELAEKRDSAGSDRRARTRHQNAMEKLIRDFAAELAEIRVLDPACGSGNFLYVALKALLDLWKEVSTFAGEVGVTPLSPLPGLSPSPVQLYGIETNTYAHELAQSTVWIGYIQWLHDNGFGIPSEPILEPLHNILHMDAILAWDENGKPYEPEWPRAEVAIGNPPFLGGGKIRGELGDSYTEALFELYRNRLPNFSDLVCYWFERARHYIELGALNRAGFLATQAIRGGANRTVLQRILDSGSIFWAIADRNWFQDGAAVHVSMLGFDDGSTTSRVLNGEAVDQINPDLSADIDITKALRLPENQSLCFMGPSAKAPFDIDQEVAATMLPASGNPNGRPNSDVVRPVASAVDLVRTSRNRWTIDFGIMEIEEASEYEAPFEYVQRVVLPVRQNRRDDYRGKWWQYARPRIEMRQAIENQERFIATPGVAKHRIFVWVNKRYLCNQGTLVFAFSDDYSFGNLQAKIHELWSRGHGTQLREAESGFRYTPTTTFETFPFPWPPGQEPVDDPKVQAIAAAAKELVEKRDAWLNPPGMTEDQLKKRTLTNLYNQRPTWLDLAHKRLDEAVLDAYGWPHDISDDEILERLLALNLERAATQ